MSVACDVLVIVAHPDDAEFGAGGSVAGWTAEEKSVVYVVCTNGDKGTSDRTMTSENLVAIRRKEQLAAARTLGVREVIFLEYKDQELEETSAFREEIVGLIRTFRPTTVVSMDPYKKYLWHRDHRIVGQVVMDALYPYARDHMAYPSMLKEGLEPHKVREALFFGSDESNYHVDISFGFQAKMAALRCHESQMSGFNAGDLESWVKKKCRKMAEGSSYDLAEAFHRVLLPA